MKIRIILITLVVLVISCHKGPKSIGDFSVPVFEETHLYFDTALKNDTVPDNQDILRLDAGRVLLKKVTLPQYEKQASVQVMVSLKSNGDPWDKSGSLFVIPKSADWSILDLEQEALKATDFKDSLIGVMPYNIKGKIFKPNVELMRFMTPFGIGFFNDDKRVKELKPVYVPQWEDQVVWQQDITQLLPLLEGEVYIGVFIDTWTKEGYEISVNLDFKESKIPNHTKREQIVRPILNTTKYASKQRFIDDFSRKTLQVDLTVERRYKNARLYYIATGHGGHSEGDEFTKKENIIRLDDTIVKQFVPWRDDCASFRRYNPASGVWTEPTTWKGKEIEERIASSDYSRSNWCPGSEVLPETIDLGDLPAGNHTFEFAIPKAQSIDGDKINYWMVSAYLVYDK